MTPDFWPSYGLAEYKRRKDFWYDFADHVLDEEQAKRFRFYGDLGLGFDSEAEEALRKLRRQSESTRL